MVIAPLVGIFAFELTLHALLLLLGFARKAAFSAARGSRSLDRKRRFVRACIVAFVKRLMHRDPERRISAAQALDDAWFDSVREEARRLFGDERASGAGAAGPQFAPVHLPGAASPPAPKKKAWWFW